MFMQPDPVLRSRIQNQGIRSRSVSVRVVRNGILAAPLRSPPLQTLRSKMGPFSRSLMSWVPGNLLRVWRSWELPDYRWCVDSGAAGSDGAGIFGHCGCSSLSVDSTLGRIESQSFFRFLFIAV
jgi:hypothetical protein